MYTRRGIGDADGGPVKPACSAWQHSFQIVGNGATSYEPCSTNFNDIAMLPGRLIYGPNNDAIGTPLVSYGVWGLLLLVLMSGGGGRR